MIGAITDIERFDRTLKAVHVAFIGIDILYGIGQFGYLHFHIRFEFIKVVIGKGIIMKANQYKYCLFEDIWHIFLIYYDNLIQFTLLLRNLCQNILLK